MRTLSIAGISYVLGINLLTFCLYGIDKHKARKGRWRISEKTLIAVAAIGGSVGAWLGMQFFRHKTRHPKFCIGIPAIFLVQAVLCYFVYRNFY